MKTAMTLLEFILATPRITDACLQLNERSLLIILIEYKFINMQSNTLFYHGHILNNIDQLERRKNRYMSFRLQFLKEHCQPIQARINAIKSEIKVYENMRDTQYEVIQSEPDVVRLKKEIQQFMDTNKYYQSKLDEFDRARADLEVQLKQRRATLHTKKQEYRLLHLANNRKLRQYQESIDNSLENNRSEYTLEQSLSSQMHKQYKNDLKLSGSLHEFNNDEENCKNVRYSIATIVDLATSNVESGTLPKIDPRKMSGRYYPNAQNRILERHRRNQQRLQKVISQYQKQGTNSQIIETERSQLKQLKQEDIKEAKMVITQFDHTQTLFRQCFERKKFSIQKSVSQLQSKLITNKDLFLKVCTVVGQKKGSLSLEQFCELTVDEITTLFISFSWLNRKIFNEFNQKRKDLMTLVKMIKSSEQ